MLPMKYQANIADEQLIKYFLNGDPNAMGTLVALYKDRIYTSIYSLVRDRQQAEEIFQAVFIKIIDNMMAGKTIEEGKFLSWAMQIANHLCIEHSRRITQSTTVLHPETNNPDRSNFPVVKMVYNANTYESHDKIRNMIDMLPEDQREVIILRHYADLSFKEISALTKCSINTALGRMRYGLINLRKMMTEKQIAL